MITDTCNCGATFRVEHDDPDWKCVAAGNERDAHKKWLDAHAPCREHPLVTIEGGPIPTIDLPHAGKG